MPARLSRLSAVFKTHGIALVEPGGGYHWKFDSGLKVYPIPAHNGLRSESSDLYIRKACACFSLDYAIVKSKL